MAALVKGLLALGLGAAAPDQDYLKLSLQAIQDAAHHLDPQAGQNFNRHQCELLVQKLSNTGRFLSDNHAFVSRDKAWWRPALRELYRVLKVAERLIEECCSEPCLKAALRQGDRTRAFAEALKEVGWYTSVVYIIIRHKKDPSVEREALPEARVVYPEQDMLEKATEADERAQRLELESWKQKHLCSVEGCGGRRQGDALCLAAQMLERLNAKGPAPGDKAASEASYQSDLWNVDYEVLPKGEHLGGGMFGNVYKTTWLGDQYVKKVFKGGKYKLESFRQEAAALGPIHHPHIVRVFSYSIWEKLLDCCLLMELMSADLSDYMRQQLKRKPESPFALPAAIDLMLQIAEGMRYLHSRKMTHRDLKSMNILVNPVSISGFSEEGFVFAKLADFGLAKTKNDVTKFGNLTLDRGTTKWMAPEIFPEHEELEHLPEAFPMKADVYSFGIVCYEILSGKQPFEGEVHSTLYQKLTAPDPLRPQLPTSCPGRLASLIRGCWVGDPRGRPAFTDVCKELRYLKGLLMTRGLPEIIVYDPNRSVLTKSSFDVEPADDQEQLLENVEMPFRTRMVKRQGPWGYSHGGSVYYDGLSTGIKAFKLWHQAIKTPSDLTAIQIEYDLNGDSFKPRQHGSHIPGFQVEKTGWELAQGVVSHCTLLGMTEDSFKKFTSAVVAHAFVRSALRVHNKIKFNYPEEYLVQVEGSTRVLMYGHASPVVTSLTFTTNQKTYGPYGIVNSETVFRTDYGKVVGFFGRSGLLIDELGVLMSLD